MLKIENNNEQRTKIRFLNKKFFYIKNYSFRGILKFNGKTIKMTGRNLCFFFLSCLTIEDTADL